MLQINANALVKQGERYLFEGALFNGVAYYLEKGMMVNSALFEDGKELKQYEDPLFADLLKEGYEAIVLTYDDEEPIFFNEKKFTGFGYIFDGHFLSEKSFYRYGFEDRGVGFYDNGMINVFDAGLDGLDEYHLWYADGKRKHAELNAKTFSLFTKFEEGGKLKNLSIQGDYFGEKETYRKSFFPLLDNMGDIEKLSLASELYLCSEGINFEILVLLINSPYFQSVEKLEISNITVGEEICDLLKQHTHLQKLKILSANDAFMAGVTKLKVLRPSLIIEVFNK